MDGFAVATEAEIVNGPTVPAADHAAPARFAGELLDRGASPETGGAITTRQPHPPAPRTWWDWCVQSAAQSFILLTIYTLSIGPMFWSWYGAVHVDGPRWIAILYGPLALLCDLCPPVGWFVNHYVDWWIL